ncbi:MAG: hypothetical protein KGM24_00790 [Elusimicrobia bacterium]|nr:hypothetical protein [Elusimicrobiota bacterium]
MKTPILAAAFLLAAASAPVLAAPDVSFDQGVDVSAVLAQAKAAAKKDAKPVKALMRYDSDCATISFGPNDKTTSDRVWLRSQEWDTQCAPVGDPRHGGGQNCWEVPGPSWSQGVRITLQGRPALLPWERDSFQVCMNGPWSYADPIETAYDYKEVSDSGSGDFTMAAGARTPEAPDPTGVQADLSTAMTLTAKDKWSSYYPGEQIALKLTLKKHVTFWPDATVLDKTVTVPVAATYALNLNAYAAEFSQTLEAGKKYYVEYQVERLGGAVSKQVFTPELKTAQVAYAPAALAFAR